MKVIPTGITSLDIATGVGGWPRGVVVEIFGRESAGKTALALYSMAEVHRMGGYTCLVNLESNITKEGWLNWAESITPDYFDPDRLQVYNVDAGKEAVEVFGKAIASNAFDLIVYDSIGAMSTDAELIPGNKKQAYGQSAAVTQLVKQSAKYAQERECVPIFLNHIRDQEAGNFTLEKAPGGHAKDHFATLRVHLKTTDFKMAKGKVDGEEIKLNFRVTARMVKNKVGAPHRVAGWNYWNYPSPEGVVGIDHFQDYMDMVLRTNQLAKDGSWYKHELFPDGKLQGGPAAIEFFKKNPEAAEELRRKMVMDSYNAIGNIMEEEDVD